MKISSLLGKPGKIYEKFHFKTKLAVLPEEDSIKEKKPAKIWTKTYFKSYARFDESKLPKPVLPNLTLSKALFERKSKRRFSRRRLTVNQISSLLYYSAGLRNNSPPWQANRFYPSGGARYPLEVYVLSIDSELPFGLYHYYLKNHSLEFLPFLQTFKYSNYFNQRWITNTKSLLLISAVFKRTTLKYGDRGYRNILLEAGHLGQNFYLTAAALNLSCCAIGGYIDDAINGLLEIDGINESIIYAFTLG